MFFEDPLQGAIIQDLIDWIDNHLDSRLDIDTVARRAGYSKWHLRIAGSPGNGINIQTAIKMVVDPVDQILNDGASVLLMQLLKMLLTGREGEI
jgi:AraC-like DNA-binding protein